MSKKRAGPPPWGARAPSPPTESWRIARRPEGTGSTRVTRISVRPPVMFADSHSSATAYRRSGSPGCWRCSPACAARQRAELGPWTIAISRGHRDEASERGNMFHRLARSPRRSVGSWSTCQGSVAPSDRGRAAGRRELIPRAPRATGTQAQPARRASAGRREQQLADPSNAGLPMSSNAGQRRIAESNSSRARATPACRCRAPPSYGDASNSPRVEQRPVVESNSSRTTPGPPMPGNAGPPMPGALRAMGTHASSNARSPSRTRATPACRCARTPSHGTRATARAASNSPRGEQRPGAESNSPRTRATSARKCRATPGATETQETARASSDGSRIRATPTRRRRCRAHPERRGASTSPGAEQRRVTESNSSRTEQRRPMPCALRSPGGCNSEQHRVTESNSTSPGRVRVALCLCMPRRATCRSGRPAIGSQPRQPWPSAPTFGRASPGGQRSRQPGRIRDRTGSSCGGSSVPRLSAWRSRRHPRHAAA